MNALPRNHRLEPAPSEHGAMLAALDGESHATPIQLIGRAATRLCLVLAERGFQTVSAIRPCSASSLLGHAEIVCLLDAVSPPLIRLAKRLLLPTGGLLFIASDQHTPSQEQAFVPDLSQSGFVTAVRFPQPVAIYRLSPGHGAAFNDVSWRRAA